MCNAELAKADRNISRVFFFFFPKVGICVLYSQEFYCGGLNRGPFPQNVHILTLDPINMFHYRA